MFEFVFDVIRAMLFESSHMRYWQLTQICRKNEFVWGTTHTTNHHHQRQTWFAKFSIDDKPQLFVKCTQILFSNYMNESAEKKMCIECFEWTVETKADVRASFTNSMEFEQQQNKWVILGNDTSTTISSLSRNLCRFIDMATHRIDMTLYIEFVSCI